jgi:hypothetical protein
VNRFVILRNSTWLGKVMTPAKPSRKLGNKQQKPASGQAKGWYAKKKLANSVGERVV